MSVHTRRSEEVVSQRKMPGIIIAFNVLPCERSFSANERLNDVPTVMTSDRSISFLYRCDKADSSIPMILSIRFNDQQPSYTDLNPLPRIGPSSRSFRLNVLSVSRNGCCAPRFSSGFHARDSSIEFSFHRHRSSPQTQIASLRAAERPPTGIKG